jgi:hypothetical protein
MKITDHSTGKTYGEDDPDHLKVKLGNLEQAVRELTEAVGERCRPEVRGNERAGVASALT